MLVAIDLMQFFFSICSEPFPVVKSIQPAKILNLIARGLAVNCSLLSKNLIIDNVAVGALIPRIHVALLTLLNSLISVYVWSESTRLTVILRNILTTFEIFRLKSHMLVYGHNVLQLMNQSLKWTSSGKSSGFQRLFWYVIVFIYHPVCFGRSCENVDLVHLGKSSVDNGGGWVRITDLYAVHRVKRVCVCF